MNGKRHCNRIKHALILSVFCGSALGAGQVMAAGTDAGAEKNVAPETPPIHIRQEAWTVLDGKPSVQSHYAHALAICQKAGAALDFVPLKDDVVKKLGHSFYDIWFKGTNVSIHSVSWGFKMGPSMPESCHFRAVRTEREAIANENGAYTINLDEGTMERDPDHRVVRTLAPVRSDAQKEQDDAEQAAVMAELKKQGYGGVVAQAQTTETPSEAAGQPCLKIENKAEGSACIWSGGAQWGFREHGPAKADGYISGYDADLTHIDVVLLPGDTIPLSATPPKDIGIQLVTREMTVGTPPDGNTFQLPPNLSAAK